MLALEEGHHELMMCRDGTPSTVKRFSTWASQPRMLPREKGY